MKTLWSKVLMLALVGTIATTFAACSDDDDDDNGSSKNSEKQQQEQQDRTLKFWAVASQLVGSDAYTTDYEGQTFEPTIGIAESDGSLVRIVQTNDLQTAAQRFANLTGATIDEDTPSYKYDDPDVGTLTYTRVADGNTWATVDVNIKQIPHLQQIVYRASSGENGSFGNVKAYYRFGDIIKRTVDGRQEYWICVRPAFTYEGKGNSHWVCVNSLPAKNIFHHDGTNGQQYNVPTGIGQDKENMQNFAEMLYAIYNGVEWEDNLENHRDGKLWGYSGMPIFGDFTGKNAKYHNSHFWNHVQTAWSYLEHRDKLITNAFGIDESKLGSICRHEKYNVPTIHLLYDGYSWLTKISWNLTLMEAVYYNGTDNNANMHSVVYREVKNNVRDFGVDVCSSVANKNNYSEFFNDDAYRWVIRHATGKQLNGGRQPAPTQAIGNGFETAYRYYAYYPQEYERIDDGNIGPEVSQEFGPELGGVATPALTGPQLGAIIGADGKFYENTVSANSYGGGALAFVCLLNGDNSVETGTTYNGLAIGIESKKSKIWYDNLDSYNCSVPLNNYSEAIERLDGLATTKSLAAGCKKHHNHPAAQWVVNDYPRQLNEEAMNSGNFSDWFLPSLGQWIKTMKGLNQSWDLTKGYNPFAHFAEIDQLRSMVQKAGITWEYYDSGLYWTCSIDNSYYPCTVGFTRIFFEKLEDCGTMPTFFSDVLPFMAFKYDGGAKNQ